MMMNDLNNKSDIEHLIGYEDEGNSTIYHVPSFLLKTYEIVDVSFQIIKLKLKNLNHLITILLDLG